MDKEVQERILREICLPCVHKGKEIPSGIAGSDVKTIERIPCEYEGTDKYCRLAHKAKDEIVKISEVDDDEEIIITGKQLKELQKHWRKLK